MAKICFLWCLLLPIACYSQVEKKLSLFALGQGHRTLYDSKFFMRKTAIAGLGVQGFLHTKSGIRPTLELNADLCTTPQIGPADEPLEPKRIIIPGLYLGYSLPFTEMAFITVSLGTNVYSNKAHFGLRPSVGVYLSRVKNWMARAALTSLFQKDRYADTNDFGYLSLGLGFKFL